MEYNYDKKKNSNVPFNKLRYTSKIIITKQCFGNHFLSKIVCNKASTPVFEFARHFL